MSVLAVVEHTLDTLAAARGLAAALGLPVAAARLAGAYTADGATAALEALIRRMRPEYVLFPHTYRTRDFAPQLAARLGRPLASDVVRFRVEAATPVFVRPLFQGKLNAELRFTSEGPRLVSLQAGAFRAEGLEAAPAIEEIVIDAGAARIRAEEPFRDAQRAVDLTGAERIVAVGRGIREQANLPLVEALAEALGAELAASRPVCDSGWLPIERQVGSSGQTVAPRLYVAVGVSGAIQHLVGMKGAGTIVAINKDERAPIFEAADYGIVGDLFEVVPALTEELRKSKG